MFIVAHTSLVCDYILRWLSYYYYFFGCRYTSYCVVCKPLICLFIFLSLSFFLLNSSFNWIRLCSFLPNVMSQTTYWFHCIQLLFRARKHMKNLHNFNSLFFLLFHYIQVVRLHRVMVRSSIKRVSYLIRQFSWT